MLTRFINATSLLWLVRQVLQFGGLWLVANGHADQGTVTETIGAIMGIIGFAGNIYASFRDKATAGGQAVPMNQLPPTAQTAIKKEVAAKDNLGDFLKGLLPKKT